MGLLLQRLCHRWHTEHTEGGKSVISQTHILSGVFRAFSATWEKYKRNCMHIWCCCKDHILWLDRSVNEIKARGKKSVCRRSPGIKVTVHHNTSNSIPQRRRTRVIARVNRTTFITCAQTILSRQFKRYANWNTKIWSGLIDCFDRNLMAWWNIKSHTHTHADQRNGDTPKSVLRFLAPATFSRTKRACTFAGVILWINLIYTDN